MMTTPDRGQIDPQIVGNEVNVLGGDETIDLA
jgi:hypothetical protein